MEFKDSSSFSHSKQRPGEIVRAVEARQLKLLFQRTPFDLMVQVIAGASAVCALYGLMPLTSLGAWLCGVSIIVGLRWLMMTAFTRGNVSGPSSTGWVAVASAANLMAGILWGLLAFANVQATNAVQLASILIVVGLVTGASVYALAPIKAAFPLFFGAAFLPWVVRAWSAPAAEATAIAVFLGFGVVLVVLFALLHEQTLELIYLRARHLLPPAARAPAFPGSEAGREDFPVARPRVGPAGLAELAPPRARPAAQSNPVKLPLAAPGKPAKIGADEPNALWSIGKRILLAEDNTDNQLVAVHLLQKRGFTVIVANNGREALALVEKQSFDLILMDLQMPEMGGLEATAAIRLREKGAARRIPIIALTASTLPGDREICLATGMDDYLCKPINRNRLYAAIDTQLAARRK